MAPWASANAPASFSIADLCTSLKGLGHRDVLKFSNFSTREFLSANTCASRSCHVACTTAITSGLRKDAVARRLASRATTETQGWDASKSSSLYGIESWGSPYFFINERGHVAVRPNADPGESIDLVDLVRELQAQGRVQPPVILRFPEIVGHRMQQLQACFDQATVRYSYQGSYRGVFPVKCNQDWGIVESIVRYGAPFGFGLEAGSKAELLLAAAALVQSPGAMLICNGYKDRAYVESALLLQQLGVRVVLVLEQEQELDLVLQASQALGISPAIGVRAKLSTRAQGHWADTSGERGKFGLTATQLLEVVAQLRAAGMLGCLQLLHFHFGSQISDIALIKEAMREGSHLYAELCLLGAKMGHIDVGGGLGVDYDGTRSATGASLNYSMQNYANDVVAAVMDACRLKGVAHPVITSESGRALASHQSVLVFNVRNATQFSEAEALAQLAALSAIGETAQGAAGQENVGSGGSATEAATLPPGAMAPQAVGDYLLATFQEVLDSMNGGNFQEAYNDAKHFKQEAASLFKLGCLSLEQRARADALFLAVCHRVLRLADSGNNNSPRDIAPLELVELRRSLASVFHCNLSIFRSAPDSWAIQQLFPIMPLGRLLQEPQEEATLADLTCDSDGRFNRFIDRTGEGQPASTLRVHGLEQGEAYYMGLFLGGVYQEAMGNSHNLFGSVTTVYARTKEGASNGAASGRQEDLHDARECSGRDQQGVLSGQLWTVDRIVAGETIEQILRSKEPGSSSSVFSHLQQAIDSAISVGALPAGKAERLKASMAKVMQSYTYLN